MDLINIKIDDKRYIQRNQFSKITIIDETNNKTYCNTINELPVNIRNILTDIQKILNNPEEYFKYSLYAPDCYIITEYIGKKIENVIIPNKINGKKVTLQEIFLGNQDIKRLYISDEISELPDHLCEDMYNLETVYISPKITNIPYACFLNCDNLKEINLENIKEIAPYGFSNCKKLNNIDMENLEIINYNAFHKCHNLFDINTPNLIVLGQEAFYNCENLRSVYFGNKLEIIRSRAFKWCGNLKKVELSNNIKTIESNAFNLCQSLKTIVFPDSLEEINDLAFSESGLEGTIYFPEKLKHIGSDAFSCTKINKVYLSKNTELDETSFPLDALINRNFYENIVKKEKTNKEESIR